MIRLTVHGAAGRMGRLVCAAATADERFDLVAAWSRDEPAPSGPIEAVIDFSSDEGARRAAELALGSRAALLVATTGLSAATRGRIERAAAAVPVIVAPNTSRGVAVLGRLAGEAARLLGGRFEIDVHEQHHRHKKDAPSGTAHHLAACIREAAGRAIPADRFHCVRAGDIVGEHVVQFTGGAERLRIEHAAISREVFAAGALDAAAWLVQQAPGQYTLAQSLGLD